MVDRDHYPSSSSSLSRDEDMTGPAAGSSHSQSDGFTVRGAPWSSIAAPDTSSMDDFPDLSQVRIWVRSAGSLLGQVIHQQHGRLSRPQSGPNLGQVGWSQLGQVIHQQHGRLSRPQSGPYLGQVSWVSIGSGHTPAAWTDDFPDPSRVCI